MQAQKFDQAFAALEQDRAQRAHDRVIHYFHTDPQRFDHFSRKLGDLTFDFSRHDVTAHTLELLCQLAQAAQLEERRKMLFSGSPINSTEQRAALHMALRNFSGAPVIVEGHDVMPDVLKVRGEVAAFAQKIRSGGLRGAKGDTFTDIVNIGIGGSDLGPAMAARALSPYADPSIKSHFVSNVDGADIADTLKRLDPARTLFIVVSKTFTTQETMTNAATARQWIVAALGESAVGDHFCAVSTQLDKVAAFGIALERTFGFWDWVGGRYSIWSAVGLSLVIAIGPEQFEALLRGAYEVDTHFQSAPLQDNIPVLMAMLGIWQHNIHGRASHALIPYDQRLARFPAYLQQLDMESNGKSVTRDGQKVTMQTGPIIWGEPGTNGQHAFFQLLHQGTEIVPVDFLIAARPTHASMEHHQLLFANCLAQGEAFLRGKSRQEVENELAKAGKSAEEIKALAPHKVFNGNRPSSTLLYPQLDPHRLGTLIALYEHKVFVQSVIWNINPFDQWGVELGKALANRLVPIVREAQAETSALDGSTAGLIVRMRALQGK